MTTIAIVRRPAGLAFVTVALLAMAAQAPAQGDDQEESYGTIEEVIVYAQKRLESLQDIPVAVSAMTGDEYTGRPPLERPLTRSR